MINIIEEIRRANECLPSLEEELKNEFDKMKKYFIVDRNVEYPDPEYLIEIGGVPTMPKGNLVAISAKWKNGKTFFCDILTAVFLGSDQFDACRSLMAEGKALFFDTEQAKSDTARIHKTIEAMIPEHRHGDFEVFCLREAAIDMDMDQNAGISRFDFINRAIEQDHPDLVIIDGIADLLYNYNDVVDSQDVVNKLAAVANRHNCCIVVVMHQNKGYNDKNMKGHLGTMLYQKCSDEFTVEKHGSVFVACHHVSRHRQTQDICFKLDAKAVPMDAAADRQLQVEMERQQNEYKLREMLNGIVPEDGTPVKRSEIVEHMVANYPFKRAKAYHVLNEIIRKGWLVEVDRSTVKLKTEKPQPLDGQMDEQTDPAVSGCQPELLNAGESTASLESS